MLKFRDLSIRKKLTALMLTVSVLILILVSGLYVADEVYSARTSLESEMKTLGAALGDSCSKLLMLRDIKATEQILFSLRVQPHVRAAYLFDETGEPVTQYLDPSANRFVLDVIQRDFADPENKFWVHLDSYRVTISWRHFGIFLPIDHDGRQVGSIYLLRDLRDLYNRLNGVVFLILSLSGILLFLSWWIAGKLQRPVSGPVLDLVETMGTISQSNDFSLRAKKQGRDEIGLLVEGFNRMLEHVETQRQKLVDHQRSLEQTVDNRTEELRRLVSVLERAKLQAEAASEAKSQFLANITHELRTPLIGVLGMNELLFRTTMDEQQRMLASTVQDSGEDLLSLINNVLDFSKIEAGKMQLEKTEFALYQTLEKVLSLLAGPAADKGLSFYSQISLAATCRVLGDEVRLRQILMNLIGNAIKFTECGSVIVKLNCTFRDAAADFVVEVIDTGIGMDPEAQQLIFSAFQQADASHTRKYGGTGLGLAIVRQLVDLIGGTLELESEVGQGSVFRICFSLQQVACSRIQLPASLLRQPVLVYLEDSICRQVLSERLTELGLVVVTVDSVTDAWYQLNAAVRSQQPFRLAFMSAKSDLPDQQPLYLAVRNESSLKSLRRILLLENSQVIDLYQQEHKLYLPVSWDNLHETISQSWHELHLVENQAEQQVAVEREAVVAFENSLLLVGGSAASQELIKVTLAKLPFTINTIKGLSQLKDQLHRTRHAAIIADLTNLPADDFFENCRHLQIDIPVFVLLGAVASSDDLPACIAGVIEKPFNRERFVRQLLPFLDQSVGIHLTDTRECGGRE